MTGLNEYNSKKREEIREKERLKWMTGVLCDKCGTELKFKNETLLCSYPPQRDVVCPNCGFTGYMVV